MKANDRERLLVRVPWVLVLGCTVFITCLFSVRAQAQQQTPTPESVSTPVTVVLVTVKTGANLRAGPGTNYPRIGGAKAGQIIEIVARNPAGDWYQLTSGAWIYGNLIESLPAVPVATDIPAPAVAMPGSLSDATATAEGDRTVPFTVKVTTNANLRAGPGTNYPKVGAASAGETLIIVAQNAAGDWYQTASGAWIYADLVTGATPLRDESRTPVLLAPTPIAVATQSLAVESESSAVLENLEQSLVLECGSQTPVVCIREAASTIRQWLIGSVIRRNISLTSLGLWGAAVLVLLVRRRWSWTVHCVLVTLLLMPIGYFITLATGLLILVSPRTDTSPREIVQNIVGSMPVQIAIWILFLALTAISILGGLIVFAMLAFCYFLFLRLLPGPGFDIPSRNVAPRLPPPKSPDGGHQSDGTSYDYSDLYLSDRDPYWDPCQGYYSNDDDKDKDRDDDSGSIWDGWLIKWND